MSTGKQTLYLCSLTGIQGKWKLMRSIPLVGLRIGNRPPKLSRKRGTLQKKNLKALEASFRKRMHRRKRSADAPAPPPKPKRLKAPPIVPSRYDRKATTGKKVVPPPLPPRDAAASMDQGKRAEDTAHGNEVEDRLAQEESESDEVLYLSNAQTMANRYFEIRMTKDQSLVAAIRTARFECELVVQDELREQDLGT